MGNQKVTLNTIALAMASTEHRPKIDGCIIPILRVAMCNNAKQLPTTVALASLSCRDAGALKAFLKCRGSKIVMKAQT